MNRTRVINGAAFQMEYAADYIRQKYEADGYLVQKLTCGDGDGSGILVQVCNSSEGVGGLLKTAIGCKNCATLKMIKENDDLKIEVGQGAWLGEGVVLTVSLFVFGPLLFTSLFGACRQKALLDQLFIDTLGFFAGSN
jgi:hypothetical protein